MQDFISLLESISEDGELTNSEIVSIVKWINNNPDRKNEWPVNEFVPLLNAVFADKEISQKESSAVGILIMKSMRQWQRINSPIQPVAPSPSFDESKALLLRLDMIETIESSDGLDQYSVDLKGPTSECTDYRAARKNLPELEIGRCCKHIFAAYARARPMEGWPSWLDSFLELGYCPWPNVKWDVFGFDDVKYLVSGPNQEWGNIYTKLDGENVKYGFNVLECRWSYGREPEHATKLADKILKLQR